MPYAMCRSRAGALIAIGATLTVGLSACGSPVAVRDATPASSRGSAPVQSSAAFAAPGAITRHRKPLAGKTVGIDPGHNGDNHDHLAYIDHQIWNGREYENCNTTGTATNGGYPEATFTWHVARHLRKDLRAEGARVVTTRHNNHGYGPCVNKRAQIINHAHADVGIDIHGDGDLTAGARGFTVLEPVKDKENRHVLRKSARFGRLVRHSILSHTTMPISNYDGVNGVWHRDDLAGLNLTKVPLVLIESGNMRNTTDARLMTSRHWQARLARAFASAITAYLTHR